jgi:hypothetical protein
MAMEYTDMHMATYIMDSLSTVKKMDMGITGGT